MPEPSHPLHKVGGFVVSVTERAAQVGPSLCSVTPGARDIWVLHPPGGYSMCRWHLGLRCRAAEKGAGGLASLSGPEVSVLPVLRPGPQGPVTFPV